MRNLRFNTMLAGLVLALTTTLTTGCESTGPIVGCLVPEEDGSQTPYYVGEGFYATRDDAEDACEAAVLAQHDDDSDDSDDENDDDAIDVPEEGDEDEDGAETLWVIVDNDVMTWVTVDGARVCLNKSRVDWDVSQDTTHTVGSGWGGTTDWYLLTHAADKYRYDGELYVCPTEAFSDSEVAFVQNYTREGASGVDDYTNWGEVVGTDPYSFMTDRTQGAPTFALCYYVIEDDDIGFDVYQPTNGACDYAIGE